MVKSHILLYHGVTKFNSEGIENISGKHMEAKEFDKQMKWLSENKNVVTLKEVNNTPDSVAITFDDAFKNVHDVALPILKKYDLPATFFITTGFVGTDKIFWVDKVEHMINYSKNTILELDLYTRTFFPVLTKEGKLNSMNSIKAFLKKAKPKIRDRIINDMKLQTDWNEEKLAENYETLSWGDVRNLDDTPKYEVGGHSENHEILSYLSSDELNYEVKHCLETLSNQLQRTVDSFSYPEGQEEHYNKEVISVLKNNGVTICPSAIDGVVDGSDDNFNLKRMMIGFWDRKFPFKEYYNG